MVPFSADQAAAVAFEVARVLESDILARAPSQSRILTYLSRCVQEGNATPSQYAIAVDGLGKPDSFDETSDSTVRVQIGRLRKSLGEYYRLNLPGQRHCIYIRKGEYRLRLGPVATAYPEIVSAADLHREPDEAAPAPVATLRPAKEQPSEASHAAPSPLLSPPPTTERSGWRPGWRSAAFGAALLAGLLTALSQFGDRPAAAGPAAYSDPPLLAKELQIAISADRGGSAAAVEQLLANDLDQVLQKSLVSRTPVGSTEEDPAYLVQLSVTDGESEAFDAFISLRDDEGRMIAERSFRADSVEQLRRTTRDIAIGFVAPAGRISRDIVSKIDSGPRNGFECFIMVENFRADGSQPGALLDQCATRFAHSSYYPYFAARQAFRSVQQLRADGGRVAPGSREWRNLLAVLQQSPDNAYANAVYSKLLIGAGQCAMARDSASRSFSRGRTYSALELAVIVDAYGCEETAGVRDYWDGRIARVADANPDRSSPLLEAYLLLGSIASGQEGLAGLRVDRPQLTGEAAQLTAFNRALQSYLEGRLTAQEMRVIRRILPTLIWNDETVAMIEAKLERRLAG